MPTARIFQFKSDKYSYKKFTIINFQDNLLGGVRNLYDSINLYAARRIFFYFLLRFENVKLNFFLIKIIINWPIKKKKEHHFMLLAIYRDW